MTDSTNSPLEGFPIPEGVTALDVREGESLADALNRVLGHGEPTPRQQFTQDFKALFDDLPEGETPSLDFILDKAKAAAAKWSYPKVVVILVNSAEDRPDHIPDVTTLTNIAGAIEFNGVLALSAKSHGV